MELSMSCGSFNVCIRNFLQLYLNVYKTEMINYVNRNNETIAHFGNCKYYFYVLEEQSDGKLTHCAKIKMFSFRKRRQDVRRTRTAFHWFDHPAFL